MNSFAPLVKLAAFLRPNSRPYTLRDDQDADLVGMRWYGYGPFHRERKPALQITKKTHFQIHTGDIIYNKLFAWRGAFGLVGPALDGMFVSDKFPTYELDRQRVDERYLVWFFQHPDIWEQSRLKSTGSAALSKFTLNPPKFLELEIPLPPIEVQRGIADKIDALSTLVVKVKDQRKTAEHADQALIWSICDEYLRRANALGKPEPLAALVEPARGISYGIVQTGADHTSGVPTVRAGDLQWFNVALSNLKKVDPAIERGYQRTRLQGNELLLRIRGGLGELAICPAALRNGNVSREVAVIPLLPRVDPRYAMFMLAAPVNQAKMRGHVRGTAYLGINLRDVRKIEIPVPTMDLQQKIVEEITALQNKANEVHELQKSAAALADRLVPSVLSGAFSGAL